MSWFAAVAILAVMPQASADLVTSGEIIDEDLDGQGDAADWSIDRIAFDVTAGTTVHFDALVIEDHSDPGIPGFSGEIDLNGDGEITGHDFQMNLYGGTSRLFTVDDGPFGNDGSRCELDGSFSYTFLATGTYWLAVGPVTFDYLDVIPFDDVDAMRGYIEDEGTADFSDLGDHFDWQVTLTATGGTLSNVRVATLGNPATVNPAAVPEPGSLLLTGLCGLGFVGGWYRKRRQAIAAAAPVRSL